MHQTQAHEMFLFKFSYFDFFRDEIINLMIQKTLKTLSKNLCIFLNSSYPLNPSNDY